MDEAHRIEAIGRAWADAYTHPERALVSLVVALRKDLPWMRQCEVDRSAERVRERWPQLGNAPAPHWRDAPFVVGRLDEVLSNEWAGDWLEHPANVVETPHDGKFYLVPRLPRLPRESIARGKPDTIDHWHLRHTILPAQVRGHHIRLVQRPRLLVGPTFRVGASGFRDGVRPEREPLGPDRFRTRELDGPARRVESVREAIRWAAAHQLNVLVLPELALSAAVVRAVLDDLVEAGIALTFLGSYHETTGVGLPHNVGRLYDRNGEIVLTQRKLSAFRLEREGIAEDIEVGDTVEMMRCGAGLVAIGICRDFMEADHEELWRTLGPDLVLVPSMGDEKTQAEHARRARDLDYRAGTVVAIANQHPQEPNHDLTGAVIYKGKEGRQSAKLRASGAAKVVYEVCVYAEVTAPP